jgi:DDE superfamily endonuclease/Tc5 transposase DNA-binding domain
MTKRKPALSNGNLTLDQKAQIVAYAAQLHKVNHVVIAKWATETFKTRQPVNRSTISRILKRKHEFQNLTNYEKTTTYRRAVTLPAVEAALKNWILDMERRKIRLSVQIIKAKAQQFAHVLAPDTNFKFSNGWYELFAKRHGFKGITLHGESGDAQMEGTEERIAEIKTKIASYPPDDVYNMDETAYLYNLAPDKTIARNQMEGAKKDKTRLTIAVTCNATGTDRVELLILGHAEKPRCFKKKSGREHGFFYLSNKKAWMTGDFFQEYLRRFNSHVGRKVLLLIDNAPSHIWNDADFPNIEIVALPPNTTSKLQPLDAGIIAAFKCHIRRQQLAYALDVLDHDDNPKPYKVDQLTAMRWARMAWRNLNATVIQNCWRHTGLLDSSDTSETSDTSDINVSVIDDGLREDYERLIVRANIKDAMAINDFLNPVEEEEILQNMKVAEYEEYILETAETVEVDEEQELAEAETGITSLYSDLSKEEELKTLAMAIAVYERRENLLYETGNVIGAIRGVQRKIRWEIEKEKQEKFKQLSIRQFLGQK